MRAMDFSLPADVAPELWTRAEAIACLRESLVKLCGEGRSMCQAAADRGIFCRGFRQWPEREFHDLWKPLIGESTHLSRAQMERFADLWQLSEQVRQGFTLDLRRAGRPPRRLPRLGRILERGPVPVLRRDPRAPGRRDGRTAHLDRNRSRASESA